MNKYTAQHILSLEKQGKFPKRIKLVEGRAAWLLPEVVAWREQKKRKGSNTVAARIRKHLRQVLTLFGLPS